MTQLSEQLADLSVRSKQAKDDIATAQTEARAQVQARIDQLKVGVASRTAKVKAAAEAMGETAATHWAVLQSQVQERVDGFNADVAAAKSEFEADRAKRKAERAEANAEGAIDFALAAIDYAEWAVLDAISARADADATK